jgi:long-chain fatty acid transport protein
MHSRSPFVPAALACGALLASREARATNAEEFPDNGSEQEGRGGAWIARASDPLAAFYNPAGLAGQPTRLTLQANFSMQNTCFARVKAQNDPTMDLVTPGGSYPKVCNNGSVFPDPQLGFTWRASDRVGLGLLVLGPSAFGNVSWPEFVGTPASPSPSRYLLIKANVVYLMPTVAVGWEALDGLRVGASFQAGVAPMIDFASTAVADQTVYDPASGDVRSEIHAKTLFVPGFTLGTIWSPMGDWEVAGWFKWSAPIDAKGDVQTAAPYFTTAVAQGNTSGVIYGDTHVPNCNQLAGAPPKCGSGDNAEVRVPQPMEAKLGVRFHPRRPGAPREPHRRDPIAQDVFDVEADLTWANDSAFDAVQIRLPASANGDGVLPASLGVVGGATLPPNADVTHQFRDVFGVRLGGDYNVLPDALAVRAGAFFESQAANSAYQNIDFDAALRFGLALGGTYRVKLGEKSLDLMLAYGHVFFGTLQNDRPTAAGLSALAGTPCASGADPAGTTATCPPTASSAGTQKYRTEWPVNLGTITSSIDVVNVGASLAF